MAPPLTSQVNSSHRVGSSKETLLGDFPGGPVVKNPPANVRDEGLIPGQGTKIPHAMGQLSLCTKLLIEKPLPCATAKTQCKPKQTNKKTPQKTESLNP